VRHIPNVLTVLRLLATPVVVWLILQRDLPHALILFFCIGMTDTIDGTLARRFGWTSRFGQVMDPLADKTLLVTVFLTMGYAGYMPGWLVGTVLARDLAILSVALWLKRKGKVTEFPPSVFGKASTFVQLLTAGSILLQWPADPAPFFYLTVALSLVSAGHYAILMRRSSQTAD
jgi:cardiolipin synthase (CMP-forming)